MRSTFVLILTAVGALVVFSLAFLFRTIDQKVREDYEFGRKHCTGSYRGLTRNYATLGALCFVWIGFVKHAWSLAMCFGVFALGLAFVFRPRKKQTK